MLLVINRLLLVVALTTAFAPATVFTNRLTCRQETTGGMSPAAGNTKDQRCRTRHPSTVDDSNGSGGGETESNPNIKVTSNNTTIAFVKSVAQ